MTHASDAAELLDGFDHVETRVEFEGRVSTGKQLVVKLGLDPTTADLHLGHALVLHKLQQFVHGGHHVVLVIGNFTARIGDPSGRNEMRPPLSEEQISANMATYAQQAGKILDMERVKLRYNAEWLEPLSLSELLKLLARVTVAQMLARNDFSARYQSNEPISLHEFLYPIAQAYDSVALGADVELGGNDQLFNLLMGREYQAHAGQREQVCMTLPLLEGLDGVKKMSKSVGNYVGIAESAQTQFGKLMSLPDGMLPRYARLAAFWPEERTRHLAAALENGSAHPMDEKKRVAADIVTLYHGHEAARHAQEFFERTVQRREVPSGNLRDMPAPAGGKVVDVLVAANFADSKRAAERLISGKGVKIDGMLVSDPKAAWTATQAAVVSVGTRKFVRVLPRGS
ncbi:MAG: tyrosine--tRNA ligase [Vulcanimicrobiaceae bacterium]